MRVLPSSSACAGVTRTNRVITTRQHVTSLRLLLTSCATLYTKREYQSDKLELSSGNFAAFDSMILSQFGSVGVNRLSLREQFCSTASGNACKSRPVRRVTVASQRHGDYVNAVSAEAPVLPFTKDAEHLEQWSKSSWRKKKAHQQPEYPEQETLVEAIAEINRMPPLVFAGECRTLQARLAKCAAGESFMLTGGDCAGRLYKQQWLKAFS